MENDNTNPNTDKPMLGSPLSSYQLHLVDHFPGHRVQGEAEASGPDDYELTNRLPSEDGTDCSRRASMGCARPRQRDRGLDTHTRDETGGVDHSTPRDWFEDTI